MSTFLWIVSIMSIAGSVLWLLVERFATKWSESVPPWADAVSGIEPHFDNGFGRRL